MPGAVGREICVDNVEVGGSESRDVGRGAVVLPWGNPFEIPEHPKKRWPQGDCDPGTSWRQLTSAQKVHSVLLGSPGSDVFIH